MKGVEAAHERFGRLPFATLFEPAIHIAESGFPVRPKFAKVIATRSGDFARLPSRTMTFAGTVNDLPHEAMVRALGLADRLVAVGGHSS